MSCHALVQGIFPTQGLNPGLPHCRQILYHLSHQGSPRILEWVTSIFQGIFPTQESYWGLLHCMWILYQLGSLLVWLSQILYDFDHLLYAPDSHLSLAHLSPPRFRHVFPIASRTLPLGCFTGTCNSAWSKLILHISSSSSMP